MRKVKIVCTMGPATEGVERLMQLIHEGMDVARINFSHGEHQDHQRMIENLRIASRKSGRPLAIMADLCGPKIRVRKMQAGGAPLTPGATVIFDSSFGGEGTASRIPHTYASLARDVVPGNRILLDDGLLQVEVIRSISDHEVECKVLVGGILKDKKGMNLPGIALSTPALTEKDKKDLEFAKQMQIDYVALSFVRHPNDISQAKIIAGPSLPVLAKIEKPEAIANLEAILKVADGAMVARGDLGIEAGPEKVPLLQKRIISSVRAYAKPVITATQMLDSMIVNPMPTRAEVSDVANAVLDGTDAVMLSAETSVGKYPLEAVRMLNTIISEIEGSEHYRHSFASKQNPSSAVTTAVVAERSFSNAIAEAAVGLNNIIDIKGIAVFSESGKSAGLLSAHRPFSPLICFSRHQQVLNRLSLYWGVIPILGEWCAEVKGIVEQAERALLERHLACSGDVIAITFGLTIASEPFQTNLVKLWKIR
ncbi:MAG: pyruvate kinase [Oligoflexia bacterium]|nr:pyruvate kinase [Oligoflexia bacterium]MBF0363928.1 pyruvate kinase [Oligoflexia bacterium]